MHADLSDRAARARENEVPASAEDQAPATATDREEPDAVEEPGLEVLCPDATGVDLGPSGPAGRRVLAGRPTARALTLVEADDVEVGIWEMTTGSVQDVEVDEVFVVISGRATVQVVGGPSTEVSPGTVVRLRAGTETVWTVHETLRKIYVAGTE